MTVKELWNMWVNWDELVPVMLYDECGDWIATYRNYSDITSEHWNLKVNTFGLTPIGSVRYVLITCEV